MPAANNMLKDLADSIAPYLEGTDTTAIHVDVADEITQIAAKATPAVDDIGVIEDTSDSANKKSFSLGSLFKMLGWVTGLSAKALPLAADLVVVEDSADSLTPKKSTLLQLLSASALISGLTAKATPIGADLLYINDSAAANVARKATISSLPIAQAQVAGILLEPAADAAVTILGTTRAIVLTVTAAPTVVIADGAGLYAGQVVSLRAAAVSGGGSYTLPVQGGTLTMNATGEEPEVMRNAANDAWVVIRLGTATIV